MALSNTKSWLRHWTEGTFDKIDIRRLQFCSWMGPSRSQIRAESWTGLDWTGLDWTGLDWTGLDWTGLDWTGLDWTGLDWTGLFWDHHTGYVLI